MTARLVELPSGRRVTFSAVGDPVAERLVVAFAEQAEAAAPDPDPATTDRSRARIVAYGRPDGVALGDRRARADWIDDIAGHLRRVESLADTTAGTAYGAVGIIGWGEGCRAAATFAARHAGRVRAVLLVDPPERRGRRVGPGRVRRRIPVRVIRSDRRSISSAWGSALEFLTADRGAAREISPRSS